MAASATEPEQNITASHSIRPKRELDKSPSPTSSITKASAAHATTPISRLEKRSINRRIENSRKTTTLVVTSQLSTLPVRVHTIIEASLVSPMCELCTISNPKQLSLRAGNVVQPIVAPGMSNVFRTATKYWA